MKKLPLGKSDFRQVMECEDYYVDKTLLIKEIINNADSVILIPRPRRFGKTMNMTMLRYFFDCIDSPLENRKLFDGMAITKEPEFDKYQGQHPVIYLTFKDVKSRNYELAIDRIKDIISDLYNEKEYLLDILNEKEKIIFKNIIDKTASLNKYAESINKLSLYLKKYFKKTPILLIDEYDTPIHTAFYENYYNDMISFLREFFGYSVKDNSNINKTVMTGILRIAKESIFSGMNNLGVFTTLNLEFADKFGFTEQEVNQLIINFNLLEYQAEIQRWYDGYIFGETIIYNPFSITNFISHYKEGLKPYWVNTASNDLIKHLVSKSNDILKNEFLYLLKNNYLTKTLDENIVFADLEKNNDNIYSFLVFTGYLKALNKQQDEENIKYDLKIPNLEVRTVFKSILQNWFAESYDYAKIDLLLKSLTKGDMETFEEVLSNFILTTLSYFDTAGKNVEKVYQAFMLGLFVNLSSYYEVKSEQESGFGRYDIALIPRDNTKLAIIMELKTINVTKNETKLKALNSALRQIKDRKYAEAVRNKGCNNILELAVVFDGKQCWVKTNKKN